jgi:uncharacterized membrane protein YhaH (DUF805 family)
MTRPYAAPDALLAEPVSLETYEPSLFSLSGRLGRLRYVMYGLLISLSGGLALGIAIAVSGFNAQSMNGMKGSMAFVALVYGLVLFSSLVLARRRLHDLNKSAWHCALLIVPLVNVVMGFWLTFGRGTEGRNHFGPAPSPNSRALVATAWVLGLLWVGLVTAAVLLPIALLPSSGGAKGF